MSAPSLAKAMATARPIPLSPPLISAAFPLSFPLPRCCSYSALGRGVILCSRPGCCDWVCFGCFFPFAGIWFNSSLVREEFGCGLKTSRVRIFNCHEPAAGFHAAEQADIQRLTRLKILSENYRAWLTKGRIRLVFGFRQTAELLKPRVEGVVLVHFGTSNWNSILSRQDKRKPASGGQAVIRVGHQIEFFLCHKLYRAGRSEEHTSELQSPCN